MSEINFRLLTDLAAKPHKHLNIVDGERYGVMVDGVFDTECGNRWPCDTSKLADGTYRDEDSE